MIRIENVSVFGISRAVYSARNAMNSWNKSDSDMDNDVLGENDLSLAKRLVKAGTDHRKFMRMITVYVDITAPLYWFKEFSTYKVGTVVNSCSTMNKIHDKEFTLDNFSHEHLFDTEDGYFKDTTIENDEYVWKSSLKMLEEYVAMLNMFRRNYLETKDKKYWWQMVQLLPSSYNQKRTVMLNYEVLANIYKSRKNHKLDCWIEFCKWIETLPYSELITGKENET